MPAGATHCGVVRVLAAVAACLLLARATSASPNCSTKKGLKTCKISRRSFLAKTGDGLCRTQVPSNEGFIIRDDAVRKGVATTQCDSPGTCACLRTKSCRTPKGKRLPACGKPLRCSDSTGAKRCTSFVACAPAALQETATVRFKSLNPAAHHCFMISGLFCHVTAKASGKHQTAIAADIICALSDLLK